MQENSGIIPPDLAKPQWENHPHSYGINRANMEMIFHFPHNWKEGSSALIPPLVVSAGSDGEQNFHSVLH